MTTTSAKLLDERAIESVAPHPVVVAEILGGHGLGKCFIYNMLERWPSG